MSTPITDDQLDERMRQRARAARDALAAQAMPHARVVARAAERHQRRIRIGGTASLCLLVVAGLALIGIPILHGSTSSANDRAAQSNLTNALTEASAVYQDNANSFVSVARLGPLLAESAPEFSWTTGTCGRSPQNCISYAVAGAVHADDGQVLVLASLSNVGVCWFVADVMAPPTRPAIVGHQRGQLGITTTGASYARSNPGRHSCTATDPFTDPPGSGFGANERWFASYSSVTSPG